MSKNICPTYDWVNILFKYSLQLALIGSYPADRIRVLLAIDGDDEDTARAAEALQDPRVTVLRHA